MATRLLTYLVSGALVIMWLDPPEGLYRYALVIGVILLAAYVDTWGRRRGRKPEEAGGNVVSLLGYRRQAPRSAATGPGPRERRGMRQVFSSPEHAEADELAQLLRTEGMRPVVVTSKGGDRRVPTQFEIRLATQDVERARPLVNWFKLRLEKSPN